MRRAIVALLLCAACACSRQPDRTFAQLFESSNNEIRRGDLTRARTLAEQGVTLTSGTPAAAWSWRFRLLQGEILLLQRQIAAVLPLLHEPIPGTTALAESRARQKYLEGVALAMQGSTADALRAAEDAGRQAAATPSLETLLDAQMLQGRLILSLGRREEGEAILTRVAEQGEAARDRYHQAAAIVNLGYGRLARSRFDEALTFFERVLSLSELETQTVYATALNNAGICYSRLGRFDRALEVQRRALAVHEKGGSQIAVEQALGAIGSSYFLNGDFRQSLEYLERAFRVSTDAGHAADAALWAGSLAAAYTDLGEWDAASRFNGEAIRLKEASASGKLFYNTLTSAAIAAGRAQPSQAAALYTSALAAAPTVPAVQWEAEAGLARLDVTASHWPEASRHFDRALDVIEKTRSDLLQLDYKLSFLTRLIRFYQECVETLVRQGQPERALEIADSSRARVLIERQGGEPIRRVRAADFTRLAQTTGSVLVSYWLAPARSYVWIVTPREMHCVALPPAADIATLVQQYQQFVEDSVGDPLSVTTSAGDQLYQILIAPVAAWIPAGASVIIVADGALHNLNLETLPVPGARRHYWLEDVTVAMAPSFAMLAAAPPVAADARRSALLIGDPLATEPAFPRLPYAGAEIAGIEHALAGTETVVYTGARATPAAYAAAQPGRFTVIHFAAHAAANRESPLDSAVVLAPADGRFKLYARDLVERSLRADLVTISACQSAGARVYSGEGLVGFAWGFLRAGARHVIAGLWDVNDRSTARLMETLYMRIAAGDAPAAALRQAKLSLVRSGTPFVKPYYWGAFEVFTIDR